jgi:hypothetical protein
MPIDRVFRLFKKDKEEPKPRIDPLLKDELAKAIQQLEEFSRQVKEDLDFVEKMDHDHKIPEDLQGED